MKAGEPDRSVRQPGRRCVRTIGLAGIVAIGLTILLQIGVVRAEPEATGARLSLHPGFTRLTVDLSEPVAVEAFLLEASRQVVIRMPSLHWRLPARADTALGAVLGFAAEPAGLGSWRLVIDVNREVLLRRAVVEAVGAAGAAGEGHRLVVELADPDLPVPESVHPTVEQLTAPANPFLPERLNGPRVIVIDPGHGGRDGGASGIAGALEKEIVLAASLALRDALEVYGNYKVLLTREDDSYLALDERSDFAVRVNADLFVSIHADAYHSTVARGASVYSLSGLASDRQAAALSGGAGRAVLLADIGYGDHDGTVGDILLDMMMDVTTVESARLAEIVVVEIGRSARLLDNSHRLAGYHVLKVPHTPAILVELGYLSNGLDATDLQNAAYRQMLAEAIASGIHRYMSGDAPARQAVTLGAAPLDSPAAETP